MIAHYDRCLAENRSHPGWFVPIATLSTTYKRGRTATECTVVPWIASTLSKISKCVTATTSDPIFVLAISRWMWTIPCQLLVIAAVVLLLYNVHGALPQFKWDDCCRNPPVRLEIIVMGALEHRYTKDMSKLIVWWLDWVLIVKLHPGCYTALRQTQLYSNQRNSGGWTWYMYNVTSTIQKVNCIGEPVLPSWHKQSGAEVEGSLT